MSRTKKQIATPSGSTRMFLIMYRLGFAGLVFAAVITQFISQLQSKTSLTNFFSFFTIESNIFAAVIFVLSAVMLYRRQSWRAMPMLRGAATLYMVVTGIVFSLLLSQLVAELQTTIPWVNTTLHYIFPAVLALDWLIDLPRTQIRFNQALAWLIFPLAYLVYSLVRGAIVHWYPYPFLDPRPAGYGHVAVAGVGIFIAFLGLTALIAKSSKFRSA